MKQLLLVFLSSVVVFTFYSCANKVMPTGGEKDIVPPVLVSAVPENNSVNFSGNKIVLTFNEYVQLKDITKQLMISPPMDQAPKIEVRKKSIIVSLPDSLRANTTYSLNFGNAIADFTEGNSIPFRYVFSTGTELDSLIFSGLLKDALTQKPYVDAIALLYDETVADSLYGFSKPSYYARTNELGIFSVRNVHRGAYKLVGLVDKNNNYTAELTDEAIGSAGEIIQLDDSVFVVAELSVQAPLKQHIKSSHSEMPGKLITTFVRPVKDPGWKFINNDPQKIIVEMNHSRDSIVLHCVPGFVDSTEVIWSDNGVIIDTVMYRASKISKKQLPPQLSVNAYPANGNALEPETVPFVLWNAPLKSIDFNKIIAKKDSTEMPVTGSFIDSLQVKTQFTADFKQGNYTLTIPAKAAEDIYGRTNDTIIITFTVPSENSTGSISLKYEPANGESKLIQLVNDKDELIRTRKTDGLLVSSFEFLSPGIYHLRAISDLNKNGRWDSGDVFRNVQPERVVYYHDAITVRANWEVEVTWKD